jgi:hypothetical protein
LVAICSWIPDLYAVLVTRWFLVSTVTVGDIPAFGSDLVEQVKRSSR